MATTLYHKIQDKVNKAAEHTSPEGQHLAVIQNEKGGAFVVEDRQTPTPGPNEYLIEVHSVALNPADHIMRDSGALISQWPTILGLDAAGVIIEAGSSIPDTAPKTGTKVLAYCSAILRGGDPNYGAFQKKVLVPYQQVAVIPEYLNFDEASKLGTSVVTAWNAFKTFDLPNRVVYTKEDKKGLLVWGGSGSVGSAAVQVAKLMGYYVFTTSGHHNHMFVQSLGAAQVFDHKKENVTEEIVTAIKETGVTVDLIIDAVGAAAQCYEVAKATGATKVATAVPPSDESSRAEGIDTRFIASPADEHQRGEWFQFVLGQWLTTVLDDKFYRPSPQTKLVSTLTPAKGGLKLVDDGLNDLKKGVSGIKLVVEI